jgi:hypothetical protein
MQSCNDSMHVTISVVWTVTRGASGVQSVDVCGGMAACLFFCRKSKPDQGIAFRHERESVAEW